MMKWLVPYAVFVGFVSSAMWPISAAETVNVPNFGMDRTAGWIAGVPMSDEPIGDDFLPLGGIGFGLVTLLVRLAPVIGLVEAASFEDDTSGEEDATDLRSTFRAGG